MDQPQPEHSAEDEAFPQGRRCYVGNLAWRTSWQDLKDHFKPCGNVVYANVMQDGQGDFIQARSWIAASHPKSDVYPLVYEFKAGLICRSVKGLGHRGIRGA
jgi:hypothetical protein